MGWDQATLLGGIVPIDFEILAPAARIERLRAEAETADAAGDRPRAARLVMAADEAMSKLGNLHGAFETYGRVIALATNGAADAVLAGGIGAFAVFSASVSPCRGGDRRRHGSG